MHKIKEKPFEEVYYRVVYDGKLCRAEEKGISIGENNFILKFLEYMILCFRFN